MKFATFEDDGREQVGWVEADRVHSIEAADMLDLIARYDAVRSGLSERRRGIALGDVRLLAAIRNEVLRPLDRSVLTELT